MHKTILHIRDIFIPIYFTSLWELLQGSSNNSTPSDMYMVIHKMWVGSTRKDESCI